MHTDFVEGTRTHGRVWELKASAVYRTFNAMLANESYVVIYANEICTLSYRFDDNDVLRVTVLCM